MNDTCLKRLKEKNSNVLINQRIDLSMNYLRMEEFWLKKKSRRKMAELHHKA